VFLFDRNKTNFVFMLQSRRLFLYKKYMKRDQKTQQEIITMLLREFIQKRKKNFNNLQN